MLSLLALAVVDSINPSAIVVTLYLLGHQRVPAQVVVYVAAIFVTYLTLGAMMMLGIDGLLPSESDCRQVRLVASRRLAHGEPSHRPKGQPSLMIAGEGSSEFRRRDGRLAPELP